MYVLINNLDGTVNYADDHPVNKNLCFTGTKLYEYPALMLCDVVDPLLEDVMMAKWDFVNRKMVVDWGIKRQIAKAWATSLLRQYNLTMSTVPDWDQLKKGKIQANIDALNGYLANSEFEKHDRPEMIVI
ncbi:hypothetical protein VXS06_14345 [Photobacterium toruni]|uniref:Uncharacterized protein n=1 Tax=Photobacterium toruni TaxID=1935446 RepID=A0ABU6L8N8_9GAMM|nr:hypothetical protein [Photobacterium toruni]